MAVNATPVGFRTAPMQGAQTAGGGFTLPQHAFVPGFGTTPVGSGRIASPTQAMAVGHVQAARTVTTPLPGAQLGRATGIRVQRAGF